MTLATKHLTDGWTLICAGQNPHLRDTFAATVPGCVHTDLMAAGAIPDPYIDLNEITTDWIGRSDWTYACTFDWKPAQANTDLVFEGLDTVATITLNGVEIGRTFNMHRTYRFEVTHHLKAGRNELSVTFANVFDYAKPLHEHYGYRPNNYPGPGHIVRKMACNFGWDWGPTLVTAGIWKPVSLQSWTDAKLDAVRPSIGLRGASGHVHLSVDITRTDDAPLLLEATVAGVTERVELTAGQTSAELDLLVPDARLWWPHGFGNQPLYDLKVALISADVTPLDQWTRRIGFRSVRLDTSDDDIGSAFTFVINDVPIYIFGANWIPDDCFPSRIPAGQTTKRIQQAKDANINMLRVWGGGIYESDAFFEACDEAGMLVWQDFLFACACYPEEEPLRSEVIAEARDNVTRLMGHTSLVLWNGNNENIWGFADWGWEPALEGRTWGLDYYLNVLPEICAELDPTRPYFAGSPYSGSEGVHPNDDNHGCKHIWDVWNTAGYEVYADYIPRFCSEFGWQAPPTWATLSGAVSDDPITPASPGVYHHQKATIGNDKLLRGLSGHLPEPTNTDDWHYLTQLNQARAITFAIAHFRSHRGQNMGAIVWQLNDCWPVTSWAAIDSGARLKPLWYAMRRVFAQHLLTFQPRDTGLKLFAVNEWTLPWRGPVKVQRKSFAGEVLAEFDFWRLVCDRFDAQSLALPDNITTPTNKAGEYLVATMLEETAYYFFDEDINLALPEPDYSIDVVCGDGDRWAVTLTAKTLLRDVCIFADRLHPDASVDDMITTVEAGSSHIFTLHCPIEVTQDALAKPGVLRCVNQVV